MAEATITIGLADGAVNRTDLSSRTRRRAVIAGSTALAVAVVALVVILLLVPDRTKEIVAIFVIVIGVLVAWSGAALVILTARPKIEQVTASADEGNTDALGEIADIIEALSKLTPAVAVVVVGGLIVGMGLWFW